MAEAVAGLLTSAVLKVAGEKVSSAIREQANLAWNFSDDLDDMQDTMVSVAAVLKDAEKQSVRNESVRVWLKRLKHAALDISSDMMDDYQDTAGTQATGKIPGVLSCLPAARKKMVLANKMKNMREKLRKINEERQRFTFTENAAASQEQQQYDERETTSFVNEAKILGREGEKKEITDLILSASHSNDGTMILPIYGLGGMGKSTLAGLVYKDTQFKQYAHRVWVYVSQKFDLKKIGRSIISQLPKDEDGALQNTDELEMIYRSLDNLFRGKKVLIVLDDIWQEDASELDKLKTMLHVGRNDSMVDVIATTRSEAIANKFCTNKTYKLQPLRDDLCWEIIKISSGFEGKSNKENLAEIGLAIAKKCGGVALAAQALGYMLKSEDLNGWSKMNNSDIWNEPYGVDNSEHMRVLPSLKLSYERMLPMLRLCFSYCAVFPKGHDIHEDELIHQWVALDFIKEPSEGKKYIKQLLGMSFLQHSKLASISGNHVVRYTMHDLVHDLSRLVIGDELIIFDAAMKSNTSEQKYCQYVFLTNYDGQKNLSNIVPNKVRALHFSSSSKLGLHDGSMFSFAKCLRVLDFSECSGILLPASIGQLKQLKCLIAPKIQQESLPKSIAKLSKLQYLNLHGSSQICALPESIGKLGCLIHLDLSGCSGMSVLPESFGSLKTMVHLDMSGCSLIRELPGSLGNLTSLQHLDLSKCPNLNKMPESIGELGCLIHLDLSGCSGMSVLPVSLGELKSMVHLNMSGCSLIRELPGSLGNLTSLQHLDLSRCSNLKEIPESLCSLTQLRHLNLSYCSKIERIPEAVGSLFNLQYIGMSFCRQIHELPESFTDLRNLLHLNLAGYSFLKGLQRALRGLTGLQYLDMSLDRYEDGYLHDAMRNLTNLKYLRFRAGIEKSSCCVDFIGTLTNLEHLNMSHNIRLEYLPESIGNLKRLHTLDLSHCRRLKSLPDSISALTLKSLLIEGCSGELIHEANSRFHYSLTLPFFNVRADDVSACSNLHLLKDANVPELTVHSLENVRLTLDWTLGADRFLDDKDLLGHLEPPRGLKDLNLYGYSSPSFPSWLMSISHHLPNLVSIKLVNLLTCSNLPALGQLPNLKELSLEYCPRVTKIDKSFCGGKGAFRRLSDFLLSNMEGLEEWSTTYSVEDAVEEFMFPVLDKLCVIRCPRLRLKPCPPIFRECKIMSSDQVISSLDEVSKIGHLTPSTSSTKLAIMVSNVEDLSLFDHFRSLQVLGIHACHKLASLPESIRHLESLQSLTLWDLSISALPEWLGDLSSLERLTIYSCESIKSLPPSIQKLTKLQELRIWNNQEL
ncbi:hypothetical protein EJB05_24745, partial [Eragrostis curvula]